MTGHNSVGGFVGSNQGEGAISRCSSCGTVEASGSDPGGFAGASSGTISASYWDTVACELADSTGGEGRTTSQMQAGTSVAYINPNGTVDGSPDPDNLM